MSERVDIESVLESSKSGEISGNAKLTGEAIDVDGGSFRMRELIESLRRKRGGTEAFDCALQRIEERALLVDRALGGDDDALIRVLVEYYGFHE